MRQFFAGESESLVARIALLAVSVAAIAAGPARAVEDTGTPGNGKWEVNFGASGIRTSNRWEAAVPESEFNYGLGDTVQLQLNVPFAVVHRDGEFSKSGLGAAIIGAKWRFVEQDAAGFSMSTFPQYTWNLLPSSVRRGIVGPGRQVLLPIQFGIERNGSGVFAEAAHNFVEMGPDEWSLGMKVKHPCASHAVCHIAVERTFVPHEPQQTMVGLGVQLALNDTFSLKGASGRDFGKRTGDQRRLILSVGLQMAF
ncbi:MAG: hypothetical protein V4578_02430 [Pseudomonadota bacterium]